MKKNYYEKSLINYQAFFSRTNLYTENANRVEQCLNTTLFVTVAVFLCLSFSFSENVSYIFAILSFSSGLLHLLFNLKFFEKNLLLSNDQEKLWTELPKDKNRFEKVLNESNKITKDEKNKSTSFFLLLQAIFIILSIVVFSLIKLKG